MVQGPPPKARIRAAGKVDSLRRCSDDASHSRSRPRASLSPAGSAVARGSMGWTPSAWCQKSGGAGTAMRRLAER